MIPGCNGDNNAHCVWQEQFTHPIIETLNQGVCQDMTGNPYNLSVTKKQFQRVASFQNLSPALY